MQSSDTIHGIRFAFESYNVPLLEFPMVSQQLSLEVCFETSSCVNSFLISSFASVMVKTLLEVLPVQYGRRRWRMLLNGTKKNAK
jgi:hypothetical protein